MLKGWTVDGDGNVILSPVTGWDMATGAGMYCLVKLELAPNPQEQRAVSAPIQLALTPAQSRSLAIDLQRAADRLEQGEGQRN